MNVTVVTSIYGAYDFVKKPLEQSVECDYVLVTDDDPGPCGWRVVVEPRQQCHPRLAAKVAKCLPWLYAPDADVTIWIDGSATIIHPEFVAMCLEVLGGDDGADMAQWKHPSRDCIYTEGDVSIAYGKYHDQNITGQMRHYRALGHPAGAGLWATGCIVRRRDPEVRYLGDRWLAEQVRWTIQDQLSEPVLLADTDLVVARLPEGLWENRWLSFGGHLG